MSDQFVDGLYAKLHAARQKAATEAVALAQSHELVAEFARTWWAEFSQLLEGKVQAWNATDETDAHFTYTRAPSGSIVLWHHSVEAELRLVESRVLLKSRVGDTQPRESSFIAFQAAQGSVSVALAGAAVGSPSDAADLFLEPILTRAFSA